MASHSTLLGAHHENIRGAGTLHLHGTVRPFAHNLAVLGEALLTLGNGNILNHPALGISTYVHGLCATLALAAVPVALWCATLLLLLRPSAVAVAHASFWASAALLLLLAFLLTNAPVAAFSGRYLVGVLLAVAALGHPPSPDASPRAVAVDSRRLDGTSRRSGAD